MLFRRHHIWNRTINKQTLKIQRIPFSIRLLGRETVSSFYLLRFLQKYPPDMAVDNSTFFQYKTIDIFISSFYGIIKAVAASGREAYARMTDRLPHRPQKWDAVASAASPLLLIHGAEIVRFLRFGSAHIGCNISCFLLEKTNPYRSRCTGATRLRGLASVKPGKRQSLRFQQSDINCVFHLEGFTEKGRVFDRYHYQGARLCCDLFFWVTCCGKSVFFTAEHFSVISRIVMNITMPCA